MGRNVNVYLSDEATESLMEIKKKEPFFNLSQFFQNALIKNIKKGHATEDILFEIKSKQVQIDSLVKEIEILKLKNKEILQKEKDDKKREEEDIKAEKVKRDNKIKQMVENLKFFYSGIDDKHARLLAEDYQDLPEDEKKGLFEYAKKIGLTSEKTQPPESNEDKPKEIKTGDAFSEL